MSLGFGSSFDYGIAEMLSGWNSGAVEGSAAAGAVIADEEEDEEEILVKIVTAGDGLVCEECADWEGEIVSIEEAEEILPIHPNCRCTIVLPDTDEDVGNLIGL